VLLLLGRLTAEHLEELQRQIDYHAPAALNLADVTLVDRVVVDFLGRCEAKNVELRRCPGYIREWIATGSRSRRDEQA
jgi:hypothetical protein